MKNKIICDTALVILLQNKLKEWKLRWLGYVQGRQEDYIVRKILQVQLPCKRNRGGPK